jgi:hypothetical protein
MQTKQGKITLSSLPLSSFHTNILQIYKIISFSFLLHSPYLFPFLSSPSFLITKQRQTLTYFGEALFFSFFFGGGGGHTRRMLTYFPHFIFFFLPSQHHEMHLRLTLWGEHAAKGMKDIKKGQHTQTEIYKKQLLLIRCSRLTK